jgi:Uma2 family endonuclease
MARRHAIIVEENNLRIPEDAFAFEGFQKWLESDEFPETGRIDYLGGDIEVDMSPEDLSTHGAPKIAITSKLHLLIEDARLGHVFSDSTRLASQFSGLSVEPDVLVVLTATLKRGNVRLTPASTRKGSDRYSGLEGAADLVVEIVSDSSVKKDMVVLPRLYAKTGIPELWLVNARGKDLRFTIHSLREGSYSMVEPDAEGWKRSSQLGWDFRFVRRPADLFPWWYALEHRKR